MRRTKPWPTYVNLGIGLPTLVPNHVDNDVELVLQSENGPPPHPFGEPMSSITLAPTLVRSTSAVREIILVTFGVLAISCAAQVVIPLPFTPVPITGQTLAVLLVGGSYGAVRGALTVFAYLALGISGATVFAAGGHGVDALLSATGGYLVGMLFAAAMVGWAAERGWDRHLVPSLLAMLVGSGVIYLVGAAWLAVSLELSPASAFKLGVQPFVVGDLLKIAMSGALLPAAWSVVEWATGKRRR